MESSCDDLGREDRFEAPAVFLEIEVYVERELECISIEGNLLLAPRKWSDKDSIPILLLRRPGADWGTLADRRLTGSCSGGDDTECSPKLLFARLILRGEKSGLEVGSSEIDLCRWGPRDFELCGRSPRLLEGGFGVEEDSARVGARGGEEDLIMTH